MSWIKVMSRGWRASAALTLALCASTGAWAPSVAWANVFADAKGADPRESLARTAMTPIGAVGAMVGGQLKWSGTGFMVGPCHMVTALHAVPEAMRGAKGPTITVGARWRTYQTRMVASGGSVGDTGDWALLRVARCPGRLATVGWMDVGGPLAGGDKPVAVMTAGFPFARGGQALTFERCRIMAADARGRAFASDCSVSAGSSGSPLYLASGRSDGQTGGAGPPVAIGLVTGEQQPTAEMLPRWDMAHTTVALSLSQALWLDEHASDLLAADWKRARNPLAPRTARGGVGGGQRQR